MKDLFTRAATTALTGLVIFGFASAAFAKTSDHEAHTRLAQAVADAGVRIIVNDDYCHRDHGKGTLYGFYSGEHRVMLICPENAKRGQIDVDWTEEDYDTLRHESVHLAQDCADGKLDHQLEAVTLGPKKLALAVLGPAAVAGIQEVYLGRGQSQHIVEMEWEAFSIAALNEPDKQAAGIKVLCGVK